jgi:hypothetical protein
MPTGFTGQSQRTKPSNEDLICGEKDIFLMHLFDVFTAEP